MEAIDRQKVKVWVPEGITFRAMVITDRPTGDVLGVAGVVHDLPYYAFSEMSDELRAYPKVIMHFIKEFKEFLRKYYVSVYAYAAPYENNADKCLHMAGFKYLYNDMQGEVYKWTR